MDDANILCLKVTGIPDDTREGEIASFLKEWCEIIQSKVIIGSPKEFVAMVKYTGDKSEFPDIVSKKALKGRDRIRVVTFPRSEFNDLMKIEEERRRAPMLFEKMDCPIPFHPDDFKSKRNVP